MRQRLMHRLFGLGIVTVLAAGCSGGGGSHSILPQTAQPAVDTQVPGSATPQNATITISIPKKKAASAIARVAPKYVSPATQSLSLAITDSTQKVVYSQTTNLLPTSPGCSTTASATLCTIKLSLVPGTYQASITTFSGTGGTGLRLSQGQNEVVTIVQGGPNVIGLTLYGIPAGLVVRPLSAAVIESQAHNFTLGGIYATPRSFNVVAVDAAGNTIVGNGAPTFAVASSNAAFTTVQPTSQAPNTFSLTPPGTQNASTQITVTASFADPTTCALSGAVCTTQAAIAYKPFSNDDWITFAHDFRRTGQETRPTSITASTVSQLSKRWSVKLPSAGIYASPLVWNGNVIVSAYSPAVVYDLSAATGAILWSRPLSLTGTGTPTIDTDDGLILVGAHPAGATPSALTALRISNGSIAWQENLPGTIRAQAVYAHGTFYEGWAGSDHPTCVNGGVTALDAKTGAREWTFITNTLTNPGGGGGVWGALAYDGTNLYFGTGNTCSHSPDMQGAVALSTSGATVWQFIADPNIGDDGDTGGGILVQNGTATFINKNGTYYNVNAATGAKIWSTPLGAGDGAGGFASAGTDGSMTVIGAGEFGAGTPAASPASSVRSMDLDRLFCPLDGKPGHKKPNDVVNGFTSKLEGVSSTGVVEWTIPMQSRIVNYTAVNNELAWVGLDTNMDALDIHTGAVIWSFANPVGALFDAGPVIVPSGVYLADEAGNVYAFSLPAAVTPAAQPRK
jgi:hypothetical protein